MSNSPKNGHLPIPELGLQVNYDKKNESKNSLLLMPGELHRDVGSAMHVPNFFPTQILPQGPQVGTSAQCRGMFSALDGLTPSR